jgi:hypothetical protein
MTIDRDELEGWFAGRLTEGWFSGPPEVRVDREEILVIGSLEDVKLEKGAREAARAAARASRVEAFREDSRGARMRIAEDAQHRFRRVVSWGVRIGGWCVKLVGEHASEWIAGMREALGEVEKRRAEGPKLN